jgi:hypothetical protein
MPTINDELRVKLGEADAECERLKAEVGRLQGLLRECVRQAETESGFDEVREDDCSICGADVSVPESNDHYEDCPIGMARAALADPTKGEGRE